ncbi:hypothetical protein [Clostridium tertium]|uniref:hypothetical protein n=1 Tax=Clostridium tertium TaxID=1559 RepID=UPI001AE83A10|nr:hypothetical protein [Clostridium tertium]MBP1869345.1 hypothetical protein [Clostridium tertium]
MEEKELTALKYVVGQINGSKDIEYKFAGLYTDMTKEIGMYIFKFLEKGLIIAKNDKWATKGGSAYNQYNNNICVIHYDLLCATQKANELIEYESKSKLEKLWYKVKKAIVGVVSDTGIEIRKQFIKWIASLIGLVIFLLVGAKVIEWVFNNIK